MRLQLTESQRDVRAAARAFLAAEMPLTTLRRRHDEGLGLDRSLWRRAAELGWTSMLVPERHGGDDHRRTGHGRGDHR